MNDKFNQAPDDMAVNYMKKPDTYQRKNRKNEALDLKKFMEKAEPMMLKVLEENTQNHFLKKGKDAAAKGNAVDIKCKLEFPKQILLLFSQEGQQAQLVKVSCIHMFESAPQNKIAIAYVIMRPSGQQINLILVFSVMTKKFTHIL